MQRIRGLIDLSFDLVDTTTHLVERTNKAVVERWARRFAAIEPLRSTAGVVSGVQTAIAGGTCTSIRLINGLTRLAVNAVADVAEAGLEQASDPDDLEIATPVRSASAQTASWCLDFLQAALNGFWGDYLSRINSRLDLGMTLHHRGRPLPAESRAFAQVPPGPTSKICVFVHGLATTEWSWSLSSDEHYGTHDVTFGTRLSADLGFTPLYVRYNTGRHVSENGRALAKLLTEVLHTYPVPIDEIALVGHSMGGLVVRSAAYSAHLNDEPWLAHLRHLVCIGTPHHGAPLEKAVRLLAAVLGRIEAAGAEVPAEILASRSSGIKDLGYSHSAEGEWLGDDPGEISADNRRIVAHVDGVGYHFLAATMASDPDHPLGKLFGDWFVRLPSASGEAAEPAGRIPLTSGTVFSGMSHFDITNHPEVYGALHDLLAT